MPYNYNYYNKPKAKSGKKNRNDRLDHQPGHRMEFERNRKKVLATQAICALCGQPVDKKIKYPHPMSATVDHIIPVSKGGHPSDLDNLQLAHFCCNRQKSDRILADENRHKNSLVEESIDNRKLPLTIDWRRFNGDNSEQLRDEVEQIEAQGKHLYADGIK